MSINRVYTVNNYCPCIIYTLYLLQSLRRDGKEDDDLSDIFDVTADGNIGTKTAEDTNRLVSEALSEDYSAKKEIELMRQLGRNNIDCNLILPFKFLVFFCCSYYLKNI